MNYVIKFLIAGLFLIVGYNFYAVSKHSAKTDLETFSSILQSASISSLSDMANKVEAKGNKATELEKEVLFDKHCQFFKKVHAGLSSTNFKTENAKQLQAQFLEQKSNIDQSCKELAKTDASKDKDFISQTHTNASSLILNMQESLIEKAKLFSLKNTVVEKLHLPLVLLAGLMILLAVLKIKKPSNWMSNSLLINVMLVAFSVFFGRQLSALYVLPALFGFIYLCYLLLIEQKVDIQKEIL